MSENEPWVTLAFKTVSVGLGVEVELWDTAGRQGVPDGRFEVGDRIGFVEVTTAANQAARAGRKAYDAQRMWKASGVAGTYCVWIDPTIPLAEHKRFVPELIRAMERLPGKHLVDIVYFLEHVNPDLFGWAVELVDHGRLEVYPWPSSKPPGSVFTVPCMSREGKSASEPDALLDGVASSMTSPVIQNRIRKLAKTGDAEQHLFVQVDNDAWAWEPWMQLAKAGNDVPTSPPEVPRHLDGLWLYSSLNQNQSCIRWIRSSGWAWHRVALPPDMSWR